MTLYCVCSVLPKSPSMTLYCVCSVLPKSPSMTLYCVCSVLPKSPSMTLYCVCSRDVNEYSNVRIFAFHTNIRMQFLDSNIRIIF